MIIKRDEKCNYSIGFKGRILSQYVFFKLVTSFVQNKKPARKHVNSGDT